MYTRNVFSFKGAAYLLRAHSKMTGKQWGSLRQIHISTMFTTPMKWSPDNGTIPPESYTKWEEACSMLSTMKDLNNL